MPAPQATGQFRSQLIPKPIGLIVRHEDDASRVIDDPSIPVCPPPFTRGPDFSMHRDITTWIQQVIDNRQTPVAGKTNGTEANQDEAALKSTATAALEPSSA